MKVFFCYSKPADPSSHTLRLPNDIPELDMVVGYCEIDPNNEQYERARIENIYKDDEYFEWLDGGGQFPTQLVGE